jgi:hypothetical protein
MPVSAEHKLVANETELKAVRHSAKKPNPKALFIFYSILRPISDPDRTESGTFVVYESPECGVKEKSSFSPHSFNIPERSLKFSHVADNMTAPAPLF